MLREALVNAFAHRDWEEAGAKVSVEVYPSHVRIHSPGLPPGGEAVPDLATGQTPSRARNPLIVQGLAWLELMDERGSGIRRMKRVMELAGQVPPRFLEEHGGVTVEIEAASPADATVPVSGEEAVPIAEDTPPTDNVALILALVDELGQVTTANCVQRPGLPRVTAWRTLSRLVEEGLLEARGAGRGTKYRRKRHHEHG